MMIKKCALSVIALCAACPAVLATELVVNGGFETGDFTGWTQFGNTGYSTVTGGGVQHTGSFGAYFGPVGSIGGIQQTISASIGDVVTVSFWLRTAGGGTNFFSANFDGATLMSVTNRATTLDYTQFTFANITVTNNNPTLSFSFRHDPILHFFDDVSVQTVDGSLVPLPSGAALASAGLALVATRRRRC